MLIDTNKNKGNAAFAVAIGYYGSNGYIVSLPLNDTQEYDLIIDNGILQKVQVKFTSQRSEQGYSQVTLRNTGGTHGGVYSRLKDTNVDLLFVVTELKEMYEIPREEFIKLSSSMSLGPDRQKYRRDSLSTIYIKKERTSNFNSKTVKKKNEKYCECGAELPNKNQTGKCLNCAMKDRRKVERPDRKTFKKELRENTFVALGEKYGISDNAIRKWCDAYKLPRRAKDIKALSDEEWDLI